MTEFFAIFGGVGITVATIFGFARGHDRGFSEGYAEGTAVARATFCKAIAAVKAEMKIGYNSKGIKFCEQVLRRVLDN